MKQICLVGFAYAGGQTKKGTRKAFEVLMRDKSIVNMCKMYNVRTLQLDPQVHSPDRREANKFKDFEFASLALRSLVRQLVQQEYFPIVFGGDHSMAVGSISGAKDCFPDLKVCWTDAHADCNTEETSASGNIHGMPVSILAGLSNSLEDRFKCLDLAKDIQYVGVRDCDPGEDALVDRFAIPIYQNLDSELSQQLFRTRNKDCPAWFSLDVDALDPSVIKATGTPVAKGLSMDQLQSIMNTVLPDAVGMDIAELNFDLCSPSEQEGQIDICREIICEVIRHKTIPTLRRTDFHNSDSEESS